MFLKQVSIFVENKPGKLYEVIELLGKENIDISALSIADTSNFGVLRLIVNQPKKAEKILKENHIIVKVNDVIAITINNEPGGLVKALGLLKDNNIDMDYMYAFVASVKNSASVMLKVSDPEKAIVIFRENNIAMINAEDIQCE